MAIDRGRRAAEVEVDARRVEPRQLGRVVGHAGRVGASSWTRTGVPLEVALPARSSGNPREGPRGSTEPDTRANSVTAWA